MGIRKIRLVTEHFDHIMRENVTVTIEVDRDILIPNTVPKHQVRNWIERILRSHPHIREIFT